MFSTTTKSGRLRITGAIVLAVGLIAAAIFYAYKLREEPSDDLNALLPRYERDMRHEIGVQQGTLGLILMEWHETLTSPGGEALMIAGLSVLVAGAFFRAAWVIDDDERERQRAERE